MVLHFELSASRSRFYNKIFLQVTPPWPLGCGCTPGQTYSLAPHTVSPSSPHSHRSASTCRVKAFQVEMNSWPSPSHSVGGGGTVKREFVSLTVPQRVLRSTTQYYRNWIHVRVYSLDLFVVVKGAGNWEVIRLGKISRHVCGPGRKDDNSTMRAPSWQRAEARRSNASGRQGTGSHCLRISSASAFLEIKQRSNIPIACIALSINTNCCNLLLNFIFLILNFGFWVKHI